MQVSFEMTREDIIAFNLYHSAQSPNLSRQRWSIILAFLFAAGVLAIMMMVPGELQKLFRGLWPVALFLFVTAVLVLFTWRRFLRKAVDQMLDEGRNRSLLGKKEVIITPVEITGVGDLKSVTLRWKAVERIELDESYLFIYYSALEAILVPRRAFAAESEFAAFAEAARSYWREAGGEKQ